jgi:PleD family two-component response regulator
VAFTPFEHEGARISVTISAGLAWGTAERVAESADSPRIAMMARADKALFEAKRRGGNTAICAPPASPGEG